MKAIVIAPDGGSVDVLDQTRLPREVALRTLRTVDEVADAIRTMVVRGAPLIGATAAWGIALAARADASDQAMAVALAQLLSTRPTAVDLLNAARAVNIAALAGPKSERAERAAAAARRITSDSAEMCRKIGEHGLAALPRLPSRPLEIMTHCNAGWLACVDHGTALAPVYLAHAKGIPVHVWVSETRPRDQGALTAWELEQRGVPFTFVADNACGAILASGKIDAVLVGSDRVTRRGDVVNKVGTYLKALAARAAGVPFFALMPSTTIDWSGGEVTIEERDTGELTDRWPARNPAFDTTPANLVTALVTERGVGTLASLYTER